MGNRAVITNDYRPNGLGLYLHWNGGRDSIESFLMYCMLQGYSGNGTDALVKLIHVITNALGAGSVELDTINNLDCDNGDNGVYVIDTNWNIIRRDCFDGTEQHEYDLKESLKYIDSKMPEQERLGAYLDAEPINVKDIKVGDTITFLHWNGYIVVSDVIGYGDDRIVNGTNVNGIPYVNLFNSAAPEDNINNYLTGFNNTEYRKVKP
jgi:hypothetical protein